VHSSRYKRSRVAARSKEKGGGEGCTNRVEVESNVIPSGRGKRVELGREG